MTSHIVKTLAVTAAMILLACESPDDKNIETARRCTDNAAQVAITNADMAASMATVCEATISGNTSPEAQKIIFGDILIEDKLLANIALSANARKSTTGNKDGLASMLPLLVDNNPLGLTPTNVSRIQTVANGTQNAGMVYVAGLVVIASTLPALASGTTPDNVPATIQACATTTTCSDPVAAAFTQMAAASCASPYDNTSTDPNNMCNKSKLIIQQAIATNGPNYTNQQLVTAIYTFSNTTH